MLFNLSGLVTPEKVVCLVCLVFIWLLAINVDCSTWDRLQHTETKWPTWFLLEQFNSFFLLKSAKVSAFNDV